MSPEVEILGAYFPGWLLASLIGVILSSASHLALSKLGLHRVLFAPVLVYACLAFLWAGLFWIFVFNR